jgi:hypothetical protein
MTESIAGSSWQDVVENGRHLFLLCSKSIAQSSQLMRQRKVMKITLKTRYGVDRFTGT